MTATLMDGKALAAKVRARVADDVQRLRHVGLATILVGDDPASHVYINLKHKDAREVGIQPIDHRLPAASSQEDVLALVEELNEDGDVDPSVTEVAAYLTPVPGGVGPMTRAMVLRNTIAAAKARRGS